MGKLLGAIRVTWLVGVSCIGAFLFAYDAGIVGGLLTMSAFQKGYGFYGADKNRIAEVSAMAASVLQAGAFAGCLCVFPMASRWGRRRPIIGSSIVFMFGTLMQSVGGDIWVFYVGRVISGMSIGSSTVLVPIYTAEMAPKIWRGRLGACFQLSFATGVAVSYWVAYLVSTHMESSTSQWRVPIMLQILPAIGLIAGMYTVPESCRWLAQRGSINRARDSLQWVRGDRRGSMTRYELAQIRAGILEEGGSCPNLHWREAFFVRNRSRILVTIAMQLIQQLTGNTLLAYFAPQVFQAIAGGTNHTDTLLTGFFGVAKVLAVITFIAVIVDRIGRRWILVAGAGFMCCCMIVLAVLVKEHPLHLDTDIPADHSAVLGRAAAGIVYTAAVFYNLSWGPTAWIYLGEIFPGRIREIGVAAGAAAHWLGHFVLSQLTPLLLAKMGWTTFILFAAGNVACMAFGWFMVKETSCRALEEMPVLFGGRENSTLFEEARRKYLFEEMSRFRRAPGMPPRLVSDEDLNRHRTGSLAHNTGSLANTYELATINPSPDDAAFRATERHYSRIEATLRENDRRNNEDA